MKNPNGIGHHRKYIKCCSNSGSTCSMGRSMLVSRTAFFLVGKENLELPSPYRPLCMLNIAEKVLQKLSGADLLKRSCRGPILKAIQFRAGRSTMRAVMDMEVMDLVHRPEAHTRFRQKAL